MATTKFLRATEGPNGPGGCRRGYFGVWQFAKRRRGHRVRKPASGVTVGLTGFEGGELKKRAQLCVHVSTAKGEYGPVEDIHLILDHLVGSFLINQCASLNAQ
jgi:hypothetical protein